MRRASSLGTASAKAWDSSVTARRRRSLAVGLSQDVFLRRGEQGQSLAWPSRDPVRPVEAVEEAAADLVLFQHEGNRLTLFDRGFPGSAALGVAGERALELVREAEVVHHQTARLVAEYPVHAGNGLHEAVAPHRLVHVHRVKARRIEARQPHVADEDDLERIARIPEPLGQRLAPGLVPDVGLPVCGVGGGARHDDLDRAPVVLVTLPSRAQGHDLAVQLHADPAAHAHDHRLAVHGREPVLEVAHQIPRQELEAPLRADQGFELRPLRLELLLALDLLSLGDLFEARIDPGALGLPELELEEPRLVVDGYGGSVLHRPLDVVDADVVAEDRPRVRVRLLDRRPREADERRIGKGVAHVAGEAVDEVVLAPVRLVGDHDDVAAIREHRVAVALLFREELLNRGEHDSPAGHSQESPQIRAAFGLNGRLPQQIAAPGKGPEELVVEVVAVGEHEDGRVLHVRMQDQAAGVEGHGQALARTLGVPDHPTRRSPDSPPGWRPASYRPRSSMPRGDGRAARSVSSTATFTAWN